MKANFQKISELVNKTKRKILIGFLILIIVLAGFILGELIIKPSLEGAVFIYEEEGGSLELSYLRGVSEPIHLLDLPAEKTLNNEYKVPGHSYLSNNGQTLIYFEKVADVPIGTISEEEDLVAYRIVYEPKLIDLKKKKITKIEQEIDAGSLVFSPNDENIAWILRAKESTIQELEQTGTKRELWISNPNGENAKKLTIFDEKVISLQRWSGDYVYFLAIRGIGYYNLGRVNVKTGRLTYSYPRYCLEDLTNCQNFVFSSSGEFFIYEAGALEEGEKTIGLFVESWDKNKSWRVLADNYVSDRLWLPGEKSIIYTEQTNTLKEGVQEKIHKVTLKTGEDEEIYVGSYISQITPDQEGRYLYFLEKETDDIFNLVRLSVKNGTAQILKSGEFNQLKIFSNN